jgi:hypothetical protein
MTAGRHPTSSSLAGSPLLLPLFTRF